MSAGDLFHPSPQRLERLDEVCTLDAESGLSLLAPESAAAPAIERLEAALGAHGLGAHRVDQGARIRLVLDPAVAPAEGYRLHVGSAGIELVGADAAGLVYGATTLGQWLAAHPPATGAACELPGITIEDWPDFAHRGVMLDVSRDKVPTLATLETLIDRLAGWKVNQLQLYVEHVFAYRGHEAVWEGASPLTPEDIRHLDGFCRARGVELVPNQNSFGHFHRWLTHDRYRPLAECPDGQPFPFGEEWRPFSLCPTDPGSLELLRDLYAQLLPNFESRWLNVGCDETFDLGRCRSAEECARRGREEVYLEFLGKVRELAAEHGRRIQFWGDIIVERPDLVARLPADATALLWGYEADHPFAEHAALFAASGLDFYVCPGTSSWNSLTGRPANAVANLAAAAAAGKARGASGYLVTDWGDFGHLQPLPASYPGLFAGAGCAWNAASSQGLADRLPALLDRHVYRDAGGVMGEASLALGAVHALPGGSVYNGSPLFFLLVKPGEALTAKRYAGMSAEGLEAARAALAAGVEKLAAADMQRPDAELVLRELTWAAELLLFACELGLARLAAGREQPIEALPAAARRHLAARLTPLLPEHRHIWLARNRPGGLDDSAARLERLLALLEG